VSIKKKRNQSQVIGFIGVGLDNKDEHRRVTQSEHFLLVGGSAETHDGMQETVIRFEEALDQKGKTLPETSPEEALDLLREVLEGR
jgi:hypothetical protein